MRGEIAIVHRIVHRTVIMGEDRRYQEHLARVKARQDEFVRASQEIGELPPVADAGRKERGRASFKSFCEDYFSEAFALGWSSDHLKAIGKIEVAV